MGRFRARVRVRVRVRVGGRVRARACPQLLSADFTVRVTATMTVRV